MAKASKAARACISREIRKHHKKGKPRGQAAAIAYSVCERKGFRSIKRRSSSQLRGPRARKLSKKAERNRTCHLAIKEIKSGNCSLTDMGWAVNEVCRRAPKNLQALLTKTVNRSCGGRLHGPRSRKF